MAREDTPRASTGMPVEAHSIDYVPVDERHGKVWHQGPFWFMGNANLTTAFTGVIGPSLGLSFLQHLTDTGLAHLRGLSDLEALSLSGCKKLTDAALSHLRGLTRLQSHAVGLLGRTVHRWKIGDGRSMPDVILALKLDGGIDAQPNNVYILQ